MGYGSRAAGAALNIAQIECQVATEIAKTKGGRKFLWWYFGFCMLVFIFCCGYGAATSGE